MPRKLFTSSSARVRLGRASREAESLSVGHGQSTTSRGYLMSKGNWNKLSERKCINCIYFLKSLLYQRFWNINKTVLTVSFLELDLILYIYLE